jgi:hypothetical protein
MQAVALLLYLISLINLALAGVVFWRHPKAEVNRVFALTSVSVATWTLTNGLFQATDSLHMAVAAANVSYLSALVVAASLLHFSQIFPQHPNRPHRRMTSRAAWSLWIVTLVLGLTPFIPHFVIQSVQLEPARRILTNFGVYPILGFVLFAVLGAILFLLRSLAVTVGKERMQTRYVLTGMAVTSVVGLVCNLVLPLFGNYSLVWVGPASSLVFVASTVYSIVKEHLFDIRLVIKRTLVYSLLLAGIAGGYSAVEYVLKEALQQTTSGTGHPLVTNIGGAIVVSLFASPVRRWLEKRVDRLIFGRRHAQHKHHPGWITTTRGEHTAHSNTAR